MRGVMAVAVCSLLTATTLGRTQSAVPLPETPVLRTRSTLVLVPALVRTKAGELVYTLTADDFVLTDNTVEQKLTLDEDAGSQPLALVVVVETGGAGTRQLNKFRKQGTMVQAVPGGVPHQVAVVGFDSRPEVLQGFTRDDSAVATAIGGLEAGDTGAATLDALRFAVDLLRDRPPAYRRAILLICETLDHGSQTTGAEAVKAIGETNTAIYTLAFSSSKSEMKHEAPKIFGQINGIGPPAPPGPAGGCMSREAPSGYEAEIPDSRFVQAWDCLSLLAPPLRVAKMAGMLMRDGLRHNVPETVAQATGGESLRFSSLKDLERDLVTVSNHVPNRYLLSFAPQSPVPGIHALELRLRDRPELVVTARGSYWVAAPPAASNQP